MNVMDAVLACYGSHKGHTPLEKNWKMWEFCRGILTGGFFLTKLLLGLMGRPWRVTVTKLDVDVDVGTRVLAMLAAFCVSGPCLTLLIYCS